MRVSTVKQRRQDKEIEKARRHSARLIAELYASWVDHKQKQENIEIAEQKRT